MAIGQRTQRTLFVRCSIFRNSKRDVLTAQIACRAERRQSAAAGGAPTQVDNPERSLTTVRVAHVLTVNKLLFFFPRAAHFLRPFLVTAPIIEIIGDRGVTAADPPRIL